MDRKIYRPTLLCLALLILFFGKENLCRAFDLSADVITVEGSSRQTGKLYVKGNKYRIQLNGGSEYAIIRHDRATAWMVLPRHKTYIEMPFDPKTTPAIEEKVPGRVTRRLMGKETVEGYATKKYHVIPGDSTARPFLQWVTVDHDFPIRTRAADGNWSIEYRNIRASVPDAFFEIPPGYNRVSLDALSSPDRLTRR